MGVGSKASPIQRGWNKPRINRRAMRRAGATRATGSTAMLNFDRLRSRPALRRNHIEGLPKAVCRWRVLCQRGAAPQQERNHNRQTPRLGGLPAHASSDGIGMIHDPELFANGFRIQQEDQRDENDTNQRRPHGRFQIASINGPSSQSAALTVQPCRLNQRMGKRFPSFFCR